MIALLYTDNVVKHAPLVTEIGERLGSIQTGRVCANLTA